MRLVGHHARHRAAETTAGVELIEEGGWKWMTTPNKRKVLRKELWDDKSLQKKGSFKWSFTESKM